MDESSSRSATAFLRGDADAPHLKRAASPPVRETAAVMMFFRQDAAPADNRLCHARPAAKADGAERFFATLGEKTRLRPVAATESGPMPPWWRDGGGALDGVVAKRLDAPYRGAEAGHAQDQCCVRATAWSAAVDYATATRSVGRAARSHNEPRLDRYVGFTRRSAIDERAALTRKLERLSGPGFRDAPGGLQPRVTSVARHGSR